jgi:hypothetical protein
MQIFAPSSTANNYGYKVAVCNRLFESIHAMKIEEHSTNTSKITGNGFAKIVALIKVPKKYASFQLL